MASKGGKTATTTSSTRKLVDPITFSEAFKVPKALLRKLGVLNPTLNIDTKLFIDPLLLGVSKHPEMQAARKRIDAHFDTVIRLLEVSRSTGDVPWRNAAKMLAFPEVKGTCLGYSAASTGGSGFGSALTAQLIDTAKQIVDIGVRDPDLFMAMALFEEGVGADRISDMTTNIALPDLLDFNERVLPQLKVAVEAFEFGDRKAMLARNPVAGGGHLLLVPRDVLRHLPIAKDWSDISSAASKNAALRGNLNRAVANLWATRTKKNKAELRSSLLGNKKAFESLLQVLKEMPKEPYDLDADPQGLVAWTEFVRMAVAAAPLDLTTYKGHALSIDEVRGVVSKIVGQFKTLIENKGIWKELWSEGKPRPEKSAQRLFFAIADSYCKAYDLDLTPEADAGNGPVDFKVSLGHSKRVLVEIKLSSNPKVVRGYERQLERYRLGEDTEHATYLVIDLGELGDREKQLLKCRNAMVAAGKRPSEIIVVDGSPRKSASKD